MLAAPALALGMDVARSTVPVLPYDRYDIQREIALTELGPRLDAFDRATGRRVAIDVASKLDDSEARARLLDDALTAQRFEGDHVLSVEGAGSLPDGTPFVVHEQALGTLAAEIHRRGPLPVGEAAARTLEVCEAIAEAHALGLAHGDVRADNVLLVRGPKGEVAAKLAWTTYAKAERRATSRAAEDIAALGRLLSMLATGRDEGDEEENSSGAPTLPTPIAHAVSRARSADESTQYADVGELAADLAPFAPPAHPCARNVSFLLSRAGIARRPLKLAPPAPHVMAASLGARSRLVGRRRIALGFVTVGAVLAVGGLLWRRSGPEPAATATSTTTTAAEWSEDAGAQADDKDQTVEKSGKSGKSGTK